MAEYIEREAFKRKLYEADCVDKYGFVICGITRINILLEQSAAADVVEVVRCKDCKCRYESASTVRHCTLSGIPVDDDDFCSYGERINDGHREHKG